MKSILAVAISAIAVSAHAQTIFYGGDTNSLLGLVSETGTSNWQTYDDFTFSGAATITSVFGNFGFGSGTRGTNLFWEIRSGMGINTGGTIVHAGTISAASISTTGRLVGSGLTEFHYESAVTPFTLAAGTYYLTVAVDGGSTRPYLAATTGTNGVGGPIGNGGAFLRLGEDTHIVSTEANYGPNARDFSMGIRGSVVPEPASIAFLGLGAIGLLRRKK